MAQTAAIRVAAFDDRNGNGLREVAEPLVIGAVVRILDAQRRIVSEETLDGQGLRTFAGLPVGNYVVIEEDAAGYRSVSPDQWGVSLSPGGEVVVMFADAVAPPATPVPSATPAATLTIAPPTQTLTLVPPTAVALAAAPTSRAKCGVSLWGVYGLMVAAVALGLLAGLLIPRRR